MKTSETRHWSLMLIFPLLAAAIGCQPSSAALSPKSVTVDEQIEFGPGSLNIGDMRAGLADASGYESTLTIKFDGTRDGQPLTWSGTYAYSASHEPLARQLKIETSGEGSGPPILMQELSGAAYEKTGEEACLADVLDPANSAIDELEPAAQLPSVFGAEEAGTDTVNGVPAAHYNFDERALAQGDLNKSTGELWLASDRGYVLRYRLTTTGDESYFGEGTQGSMSWDYELTQINAPVTIALPEDCLPGLVDAPMLPDAAKVESLPALLRYETASSLPDVVAFYEKELPALGWQAPASGGLPEGMSAEEYQQALEALQALGLGQAGQPGEPTPTPNPDEAYMVFDQGGQRLRVTLTRVGSTTQVSIALGNNTQ